MLWSRLFTPTYSQESLAGASSPQSRVQWVQGHLRPVGSRGVLVVELAEETQTPRRRGPRVQVKPAQVRPMGLHAPQHAVTLRAPTRRPL